MNSLILPSSFLRSSLSRQSLLCPSLQPHYVCTNHQRHPGQWITSLSLSFPSSSDYSFHLHKSFVSCTPPPKEGAVSVINFEDFVEKDWSFLEDEVNSKEHNQKINRIISAAGLEETSRVLVSIGSEGFVDQLVDTSPCNFLLVVHDSLLLLAGIKEKYDEVKCWQGELIYVPEKWLRFDVVFLYFLPALPFKLDEVFGALAKRCSPGARLVISHPQGREILEQQRKQYADVIVSDLPDKMTLQKVAADHSFEMDEFVDQPGFYLAVLRFREAKN